MNTEWIKLKEAVRIALNDGAHSEWCSAIHGPDGETWTVEKDCDCWKRDMRMKLQGMDIL